jgi:hypothetical protein
MEFDDEAIYLNKITNLKSKENNEKTNINKRKNRTINKTDLNTQNLRLSKEEIPNTKYNNLTIITQKNKRKTIHKKKNSFKKINDNPFLTEISFPNYDKRKKLKILPTSVYFINMKKKKEDIKNNLGKSIFSKISEAIYEHDKIKEKYPNKKVLNLEKIAEDNYNQLTEEAYLYSIVNKKNNENKKIINEFLQRKKKEEKSKKIGIENDSTLIFETLKDLKRSNNLTDRNRSFKSSRTLMEFLQDQKLKEEKHKMLLKKNEILKNEKINLIIRDRPYLNEESIKIMNSINRNKKDIHKRLYEEYKLKEKREKQKQKEIIHLAKNKGKKISQKEIEENSKRLYSSNIKKNRNNENQKNVTANNYSKINPSINKNSNEIIFKRFRKKLEDSFENLCQKNIKEEFELSYLEFLNLLYYAGFTNKNYSEIIEQKFKENILLNKKESLGMKYYLSKDFIIDNIICKRDKLDISSKTEESINMNNKKYKEIKNNLNKQNFLVNEIEYKLSKDAWKLIISNKEFNDKDIAYSTKIIYFFLNVFGNKDNCNKYIKKEFSENIKVLNELNNLNLSDYTYKYFQIFRNNAINKLLIREDGNKRKNEIKYQNKNGPTFSLKKTFDYSNRNNYILNINHKNNENNINFYLKNKERKVKKIEKVMNDQEKKSYTFFPFSSTVNDKINIDEKTKILTNLSDKNIMAKKELNENLNSNLKNKSFNSKSNLSKMFKKNPLEKDVIVMKKIRELKEARNQRNYQRMVKEKGLRINDIENIYNSNNENLFEYKDRFVHVDEPLNNFKNTFRKYESSSLKDKYIKKVKYTFEIFVENKPKKLIIYYGDDVNIKIREFCNKYKLGYNDKQQIFNTITKQIKDANNIYH